MPCSPAQLAANRANAQKSTGPRTPEGKARSRANSLRHGLCATAVVPEDLDAVQARARQWYHTLCPQTPHQAWLVDRVALCSLRIERCERMERRLRDRKSMVAEEDWEDDRRLEAEALGARIAARPAEVAERLRRTPAGCLWLASRWSMLARLAEVNRGWTDEQEALAFHLLGTPLELRGGLRPGEALDEAGRVVGPADGLAELARRESAGLMERAEMVSGRDEVDRALTEADLFDDAHDELRRLRRHEAMLHNRMRWCLERFEYESPRHHPDPRFLPTWKVEEGPEAEPQAAEATAPSATATATAPGSALREHREAGRARPIPPPFDLEPWEVPAGRARPDLGAIAIAREVKRREKAEARREARRRGRERLRA